MDTRYWNIKKTASYNCLMNFIIGSRGAGKTYGALKYGVEAFVNSVKAGKCDQFIYMRRHETELEKLTKSREGRLFHAVRHEFPKYKLSVESNTLYIEFPAPECELYNLPQRRIVMGYAIPLSTASKNKSDGFPDVSNIFYDEFIIDNRGVYHYLKDEVRLWQDAYETIARPGTDHKRVTAWFLSNAVSVANPYFDYYHLDKPVNGHIQRFGAARGILVENVVSNALVEAKASSEFYQIHRDTEYFDYAVKNEWLIDNNDFIERKTQRAKYFLTLRYMDTYIGVWRDYLQGLIFISNDVDMQFPNVYSATMDDHKPNVMLLKAGKKTAWLQVLIEHYNLGCVRYENLRLKSWFRDIMRMCNC